MKYSIISIGVFDGVHIGHQKLIKRIIEEKYKNNYLAVLLTFYRPFEKIDGLLTTPDEKFDILSCFELDKIELLAPDYNFYNFTPEEFFYNFLLKKYNVKKIVVGYDFKFGKNRTGDIKTLYALCKKTKIELIKIHPVIYNKKIVSSSYLRNLIKNSKFDIANEILTVPYFIYAKVIKGKGIARKFGLVPTANLEVNKEKLLPAGIFCSKVIIDEKIFDGALSIGYNSTFKNEKNMLIPEVHIIDFNKNILNKKIKIIPYKKIRDEIKFKNPQDLKKQILKDIEYCKGEKYEIRKHT